MDIKIIEKKEIPLLSRTRVTMAVKVQGATPSLDEMRKHAAKQLGADEKLTVVRHIYPRFGKSEAKIIVHVYKNEKEMLSIEDKVALKKHIKEEKKPEAAPAAAEAPKAEV